MKKPSKRDVGEILEDPAAWLEKHGTPTNIFNEIHQAQETENARHLIDWDRVERERDEASLMPQVVGRETC